jgi:anti-anti-sigma factor
MTGMCKAIGDVDFATAPFLKSELRHAIRTSSHAIVVVDCSDLTFMDAAGFHALVAGTRYAADLGRTLVIRNISPTCAMVIGVCDWDNELNVEVVRTSA